MMVAPRAGVMFPLLLAFLVSSCSVASELQSTGSSPTPTFHAQASSKGPSSRALRSTPASSTSSTPSAASTPGSSFQPSPSPLPLSARIAPECVARGGAVRMDIDTVPQAKVIYSAVYSDGKGGGPAPYGRNYGGEGSGAADSSGHFSASWTVSPQAPTGSAHVNMAAAAPGYSIGKARLSFAVAQPTGGC